MSGLALTPSELGRNFPSTINLPPLLLLRLSFISFLSLFAHRFCVLRSSFFTSFNSTLIGGSSMATNRPQVPLHCSICPKKPNFSDVSHLLTHIASKSHLSHYYKVKIRAATDNDARLQVHNYDNWYDHFDVETLMAERLALKDDKKTRQRAPQGLLYSICHNNSFCSLVSRSTTDQETEDRSCICTCISTHATTKLSRDRPSPTLSNFELSNSCTKQT